MKKIFLITLLLLSMLPAAMAQYEADKWYISPKISFENSGSENWTGFSSDRIPPTEIQIDYGLSRIFSVGTSIGFYKNKYTNDTIPSNKSLDYSIGIGGVASYHFAEGLERLLNYGWDLSDFDLFLSLGVRMEYLKTNRQDFLNNDGITRSSTSSSNFRFRGGPSIGARYYLNRSFAMSLEAGWSNMGIISMGLSWKFSKK